VKVGSKLPKDKVYLPIISCEQCPFCDQSRYYTADSFEFVTAWNCKHPKLRRQVNATTDRQKWRSPPGIARHESGDKDPPIPEWCPLRA